MNANSAYNMARVGDTNFGQRLGGLADQGMEAYVSGGGDFGGGSFGNFMQGAYGQGQSDPLQDAISKLLGGGNSYNMGGGSAYNSSATSPEMKALGLDFKHSGWGG